MLQNYFKIALRNLLKHKLYSFINIFGLSVGIAFVVLIFLFVQHELSYDKFHTNGENIYRLNEVEYRAPGIADETSMFKPEQENLAKYAYLPVPTGPTMQEEIPEVMRYTRFAGTDVIVRRGNRVFPEKLSLVDSTFFELFSFPLLQGDPTEVLDEKYQVVLTPEMVTKYFGSEDPIGKQLEITSYRDTLLCTVTGVAQTPPANSSLDFALLANIQHKPYYERNMTRWGSFNTPVFLELAEGTNMATLQPKLAAFAETHLSETIDWLKDRFALSETDNMFELTLTPLANVHLENTIRWEGTGNPLNIFILSGLALLILFIACLNYISLALTGASGRTLEVGIRKVLGSTRPELAKQFWMEAQLLVVVALVVGVLLVDLFLPTFNEFVQRELQFSLLQHSGLILVLLGITFLTGLIAGGYPALIISRFRPIRIMQGSTYRYKPRFTKAIVVVQYAMSALLIISALTMYRQMQFVNNKDLGYDKEQILVLQTHDGASESSEQLVQRLKNELQGEVSISNIAATNISFNKGFDIRGIEFNGDPYAPFFYRVDENYLPTLDIQVLQGRNFSKDITTDATEAAIINETFAQQLQLDDPLGAVIALSEERKFTVIGVVEDYNVVSLNEPMQPVLLMQHPEEAGYESILIKLSGTQIPQAVQTVQQAWKTVAPTKPFTYTFLDEDVAAQYESYTRWMSIIGVSTLFAIFIACLGLFGLAGMMAVNKQKEIGIRKVMGAEVENILMLLNKDLVKLALLALLIAGPLGWWMMQKWLANFEFKIEIGWEIFALSGGLCLLLALLTVSYHSLRAALANPVESLRSE